MPPPPVDCNAWVAHRMPVPRLARPVPLADSARCAPCGSPLGLSGPWCVGLVENVLVVRSNVYCASGIFPGHTYMYEAVGPSQKIGLPTIHCGGFATVRRCTIWGGASGSVGRKPPITSRLST